MMKKRIAGIAAALAVMMTMLVTSSVTVMASAPSIEEIEHKGKGRIEVGFYGDVSYKKAKVTVKDTKGRKYKVSNVRKDDDDIRFTIKNYKKGKTYKFTIKGVKERGSSKYGKVSGKVRIPKAASGKDISKSDALSKAKKHAASTWGTKDIYGTRAEKDKENGTRVWEVEFKGYENGTLYEYDYKIAVKGGKIIRSEREIDD